MARELRKRIADEMFRHVALPRLNMTSIGVKPGYAGELRKRILFRHTEPVEVSHPLL